ncbi:unnamed protein product [Owenia fusiformis]|uniref:Uncharacterized protein n=1 Tax=Owenia fusiformis TaxID=6347 RepID=A0A8S4NEK8_OWEFU|nr:unnamed protein product [Owenia fusiformis]
MSPYFGGDMKNPNVMSQSTTATVFSDTRIFSKMLKFVCLFALVAIACAAPRSYGYGDDENRDGVPDSRDANRDGKIDYGYGYGYARNSYGYGSYGYQPYGYEYVPYGDGYPYANVGPNGAVVKLERLLDPMDTLPPKDMDINIKMVKSSTFNKDDCATKQSTSQSINLL